MGWSTWNALKDSYNESTIHTIAERLNTLGLKDAGYQYLLLDEGWSDYNRTDDGFLQANRSTFPSGISALSSYVHSKGLKLGLYGDSGVLTCGFRPGSLGFEERDALTLAGWGVDYWKYDNCGGYAGMTRAPQERFGVMKYVLERAGREIFYAVCEWGFQFPWLWGGSIGHSYRMSGDITATFTNETTCPCKTAYCLNTGYAGCSVLTILRKMREISSFQEPGHWLDMDMLEIGVANMTLHMQQTHMAFWAALKSPLVIGADLGSLGKESLGVLMNSDIIAVNQDSLGKAVRYVEGDGGSVEVEVQVWVGEVEGGYVVLVFNERSYPRDVSVEFLKLGIEIGDGVVSVRELWSGENWGRRDSVEVNLQAYQTIVLKLT
ncbi:glycoside hydrolase family 27 protein [Aspergillus stella-maris]|uniref:glycoside hydrolase family 27 protein n=1 Tax=Aspergillus stella-maris TaxID=1810926 RepID=UPI003CCCFC61